MTAELIHRLHFAFTITFHYLFPQLTMPTTPLSWLHPRPRAFVTTTMRPQPELKCITSTLSHNAHALQE